MALTRILHCLADAEPTAFHAEPNVFAINLSFDCISDGVGNVPRDLEEQEARDAFEMFCSAAAAGVTFAVYRRHDDHLEFVRDARHILPAAPTPTGVSPGFDVMAWLDMSFAAWSRHPDRGPEDRFWTSLDADKRETEVDAEVAGAAARLRSAQAWNAPVGHRFGLTYLVRLEAAPDPEDVVLPFFGGAAAPSGPIPLQPYPSSGTIGDPSTLLDCINGLGGAFADLCRTSRLREPDATDTLDGRLTPEGFFKVNPKAEPLRRFLNGFEQRASGLLSSVRAIALQETGKPGSSEYGKLFRIEKTASGGVLRGPAAWAVTSGLLASLDMLVLSIVKPVTGNRSEGEVLAPLVSAILTQIGKIKPPPAWASTLISNVAIAVAIRESLKSSKLFKARNLPAAELVALLRSIHGLGHAPPEDAPADIRLLHRLLTRYAEGHPTGDTDLSSEDVAAIGDAPPLDFVLRPVFDVEAKLGGEAGAEAAIKRLFELVAGTPVVAAKLAPEVAKAFEVHPAADMPMLEAALDNAWVDYRAILDDRFNGAEALRRSASAEFSAALFDGLGIQLPTPKDLISRIQGDNYFKMRLSRTPGDTPPCFSKIVDCLVRVPTLDTEIVAVRSHLDATFAATTADLISLAGLGTRFVPDTVPQPLPIQIAADLSGDLLEPFLSDFNGIAVAIRRVEPGSAGTQSYSHANLAELHWPSPWVTSDAPGPAYETRVISPVLPAVSDGRGPMFLEYQGFPFVPSGFAEVAVSAGEGLGDPARVPFYKVEIADPDAIGQPRLPGLAYGRWVESYAFALTNAGTLPLCLQQPAASAGDALAAPWLPGKAGPPYDTVEDNKDVIARSACQRRTAIGEMGLTETRAGPGGERIGRAVDGVVALASDYPRLHLYASGKADGTLDLYRDPDGVGTLALGRDFGERVIVFDDLALSDNATLQLLPCLGPASCSPPDESRDGIVPLSPLNRRLTVNFVRVAFGTAERNADASGDATVPETVEIQVRYVLDADPPKLLGTVRGDATDLLWLRLVLSVVPEGPETCLSFAAPDGATGSRPLGRLLLLAPDDRDVWQEGIPSSVEAEVTTPRVGYLDFVRWMTNTDLRKALGPAADPFMNGLSMAYAMRHVDPRLAAALDRLPDPAVDRVRLTIATTDTVGGATAFSPDAHELDLSGGLSEVADAFGAFWHTHAPAPGDWPSLKPKDMLSRLLTELLDPLDKRFRFRVRLSSASGDPIDLAKTTFTIRVAPGLVADLAAETLVRRPLFGGADRAAEAPGVIHEGLLQYASREGRDGYVSFPSFALRVETMIDAVPDMADEIRHGRFIALAERMVALVPAGSSRHYDLVAPPPPTAVPEPSILDGEAPETEEPTTADFDEWRLYSHVDVISQRWRPSGRPAYRALDPKRKAWGGRADTAAFRLAWRVPEAGIVDSDTFREAIANYEREVFFDRPNVDADPSTQKLLPLPAVTTLQSFPWDPPSATYLRHRFTLRSRYAGALRKLGRQEVNAFPPIKRHGSPRKPISDTWTLRAVILADFTRVQVARPQLRALIPLTSTPEQAGTPPVLAILQEPPFSHGGLADRVTAELKTGFGYGFQRDEEAGKPLPTVEILDSRKEIGPDPRLDYMPTPHAEMLRLGLSAEGPIGLTFDPIQAGVPTFPNSAFLLTPRRPEGGSSSYEEHFLGVSMSRHLDPAWTFVAPGRSRSGGALLGNVAPNMRSLAADQAWWITLGASVVSDALGQTNPAPLLEADRLVVLSAAAVASFVALSATKLAVDGVEGDTEKTVEVAHLPCGSGVSILHRPIAPGRFLLSVFADAGAATPDEISTGMSAAPLMMTSFEWSLPEDGSPRDDWLRVPEQAEAQPVLASAPTFLAWARTLRAFDQVTVAHPRRRPEADRVNVEGLRASIEERKLLGGSTVEVVAILEGAAGRFLTASTEADPFPVEVHRHLAFMLTRLLDGPGGPVEEFVRAGRFCGAEAQMPAGATSSTDRLNLRLIELETPAAILCGTQSDAIPEVFRRRYFDFVSTGSREAKAATLFLRPVGSEVRLGKLETLRLSVATDDVLGPTSCCEIAIPPGEAVRMIEVDFLGGPTVARVIRLSGTYENCAVNPVNGRPLPALSGSGAFVTVDAAPKGASGEFWCDVSLLHSERQDAGAFDFDWIFSPSNTDDIASSLSPEQLVKRPEVQARINSVSPPIAAFRKGPKAAAQDRS